MAELFKKMTLEEAAFNWFEIRDKITGISGLEENREEFSKALTALGFAEHQLMHTIRELKASNGK